MPAIVKCDKKIRKDIESFLLDEFEEILEDIDTCGEDVVIKESSVGLDIEFPVGEIYGYTQDYVECIPYVFQELKDKYPEIAIWGYAYEYETISAVTYGPLFYCEKEDKKLVVKYKWQECICCFEVIAKEAFYNSSQWDFGEGNTSCVCSPLCMLAYLLCDLHYGLEPNDSIDEDASEEILDSDNCDEMLKEHLAKDFFANIDKYMDDFKEHKENIIELSKRDDIYPERRKYLDEIMKRIGA